MAGGISASSPGARKTSALRSASTRPHDARSSAPSSRAKRHHPDPAPPRTEPPRSTRHGEPASRREPIACDAPPPRPSLRTERGNPESPAARTGLRRDPGASRKGHLPDRHRERSASIRLPSHDAPDRVAKPRPRSPRSRPHRQQQRAAPPAYRRNAASPIAVASKAKRSIFSRVVKPAARRIPRRIAERRPLRAPSRAKRSNSSPDASHATAPAPAARHRCIAAAQSPRPSLRAKRGNPGPRPMRRAGFLPRTPATDTPHPPRVRESVR